MTEENKDTLNTKEQEMLWKSMDELGYSEEEITAKKEEYLEKAKKAPEKEEEVKEDKKETKGEVAEKEDKEEKEEDMEKSFKDMYKGMKDMYSKMEKAMTQLEDLTGKLPLVNQAQENTALTKSEKTEEVVEDVIEKAVEDKVEEVIEKSEEPDIMKSFMEKFDTFAQGMNEKLEKSEQENADLKKSFEDYLDSPLTNRKPIQNSYNLIEKSEQFDDKGKRVLSLSTEGNEIIKSLNECLSETDNEDETKMLTGAIFNMTCSKTMAPDAGFYLQTKKNLEFRA